MKQTFLMTALQNGAKRIPMGLGFALALTFPHLNATAQEVDLGAANSYAVLAGTTITDTGSTTINNGDIGVSPGSAITGLSSITLNGGVVDMGDAACAQTALTAAFIQAAGFGHTALNNLTGQNLGGLTLTPGVYFFSSSADLTGTLTLDDQHNPDAVFIFQIGTALTTAGAVVTINDPSSTPGTSVFWQVGSSATLGTGTAFQGNILAADSITLVTGSTDLDGRLLAETGAVTLDTDTITAPPAEPQGGGGGNGGGGGGVPDTGSTLLLLGSGLAALFAFGRRFSVLLR